MKDLAIRLRDIKNDEDGFAITIVFLLILPLMLFFTISSFEITRTERATNETLQQALSNAVNDAAHMIDRESQAMGEPRIDHERAYSQFKESLEHNLTLTDGMAGEASSVKGNITYWLLIYNGDDKYSGYKGGKVASYAYYTNENGHDNLVIDNSITGFPQSLDISKNGFVEHEGIIASIESPSVVAIIRTNINPASQQRGEEVTRWAMAKVIKKERENR